MVLSQKKRDLSFLQICFSSGPQETILFNAGRKGKNYFQFTASLCHSTLLHFINKKYPKACKGLVVTPGDKEGLGRTSEDAAASACTRSMGQGSLLQQPQHRAGLEVVAELIQAQKNSPDDSLHLL